VEAVALDYRLTTMPNHEGNITHLKYALLASAASLFAMMNPSSPEDVSLGRFDSVSDKFLSTKVGCCRRLQRTRNYTTTCNRLDWRVHVYRATL